MRCPMCDGEIAGFKITQDHQKLQHCPDGYDVITSKFGIFPIFVPRSGKTEELYIPGRSHTTLTPCGCPVDKVECVGPGVFKFNGRDRDLRPVEFTGPITRITSGMEKD